MWLLVYLPLNFRNDLQVWQVYAEMEWLSGNTEEARRVFDATLMMGAEMFPDEQSRRRALAPLFRSLTLSGYNGQEYFYVNEH